MKKLIFFFLVSYVSVAQTVVNLPSGFPVSLSSNKLTGLLPDAKIAGISYSKVTGKPVFVLNQIIYGNGTDTALQSSMLLFNGTQLSVGGNTPHSSSVLDLHSTTQGFSPPQMTSTQRMAIVSPKTGLIVLDITLDSLFYFDGIDWVSY